MPRTLLGTSVGLALLGVAILTPAGSAEAALITFEGSFNSVYNSPIVRSGYEIGNPIGDQQHFHEVDSTAFGLPSNGTGILANDRDTRIFVMADGGTTAEFTLDMVDVASLGSLNSAGLGLTIEGFLGGISTGLIDIGSLGGGYTTVLGASLGVMDQLIFDGYGGGGGFALDNLALTEASPSEVPEPATIGLLVIGLAGLGFSGRRRRQ